MCEFTNLDRCAAYVAARSALIAVQRVATAWPERLADRACHAAIDTLQLTAAAASHDHASAGRRQRLRDAIAAALGVAAALDAAREIGLGGDDLHDVQRLTGRTIALLGMFLHATTAPLAAAADHPAASGNPRTETVSIGQISVITDIATKAGRVSRRHPRDPTGSRDLTTPVATDSDVLADPR